MKRILIPLLSSAMIFIGCSTITEPVAIGTTTAPAPIDSSTPSDQEQLLKLVNWVRSEGCRCGGRWFPPVDSVQWDTLLETIAEKHSNDMVQRHYYSHRTLEGVTTWERMWAGGYDFLKAGENIGGGYRSAESVVAGWLESPGHCRIIMNGDYTHMGVGRVNNVWTQLFALPTNGESF